MAYRYVDQYSAMELMSKNGPSLRVHPEGKDHHECRV